MSLWETLSKSVSLRAMEKHDKDAAAQISILFGTI